MSKIQFGIYTLTNNLFAIDHNFGFLNNRMNIIIAI